MVGGGVDNDFAIDSKVRYYIRQMACYPCNRFGAADEQVRIPRGGLCPPPARHASALLLLWRPSLRCTTVIYKINLIYAKEVNYGWWVVPPCSCQYYHPSQWAAILTVLRVRMNDHYLQSKPVRTGAFSVIYTARSFIVSGEITRLVIPTGGGVPMVILAGYPWTFL